ncbi:MAG: NAD-dependent epimerase/dehydratase family protein [Gemmataceae bacterium]
MDEADAGWRGLRVLVTGGTGFLGAAVVERLVGAGAEVVGLVRDRATAGVLARHRLAGRVHILHGRTDDLFRVHSALAVHEVQRVLHFPPATADAQDRGLITVLEAVRKYDARIPVVFPRFGSAASLIASPVPLGVARFDELFGPGDEERGTVATLAQALLEGTRTFAFDSTSRDYVPVADAALACLMLANAVATHPVAHIREARFRTGWTFTDREMHSAIREVLDGRIPSIPFLSVPPNPLGWSPQREFGPALAEAVEGIRVPIRPQRLRAAA